MNLRELSQWLELVDAESDGLSSVSARRMLLLQTFLLHWHLIRGMCIVTVQHIQQYFLNPNKAKLNQLQQNTPWVSSPELTQCRQTIHINEHFSHCHIHSMAQVHKQTVQTFLFIYGFFNFFSMYTLFCLQVCIMDRRGQQISVDVYEPSCG